MAELIYAGSVHEYNDWCRDNNKIGGDVKYVSDPLALRHATRGTVVRAIGSYQARMDYGQVWQICNEAGLHFTG